MTGAHIAPMPPTSRYPYVRWAVTRPDGWGRPVTRFCDALRHAQTLTTGEPTMMARLVCWFRGHRFWWYGDGRGWTCRRCQQPKPTRTAR